MGIRSRVLTINMRIAIVGSRGYKDLDGIELFMRLLPKDSIIVSGGAPGVDRHAEKIAKMIGLECEIFKADWDKYGKSAGVIRNQIIVKNSDYIVCFYDGSSRGTDGTIKLAKNLNKNLIVVADEGER